MTTNMASFLYTFFAALPQTLTYAYYIVYYLHMASKIYCVIPVALFVIFSYGISAQASEQDRPLTASVTVSSIFNMSISSAMIDFGTVDPGSTTAEKTVTISCTTNNNRPWGLALRAQQPFTFQEREIPAENFNWRIGVQKGSGSPAPAGKMSLASTNVYKAGMNDQITRAPVEITLNMSVTVPPGQMAGRYTTVLTLSMAEE